MSEQTVEVRCVPAAPCWVSLMAREIATAQAFYGPLLDWEFEPGADRWGPHVRAVVDGVEVAGIGALPAGGWQPPVAWTTYFGTEAADGTADRIRERGGTLAVGPIAFETGRLALAADPYGAAFGIWEGDLGCATWVESPGAPVWIELRTGDPFASALFYGEVFLWDGRDPRQFEVRYEHERVVLRSQGRSVAALRRAEGQVAPHWEVFFSVADTDRAVERAIALGGGAVEPPSDSPYGRVARLRDVEGGLFSVIAPKG